MRRAVLVVLVLAALGQVYFAVSAEVANLGELPKNLARFRPHTFANASEDLQRQSYLVLTELARRIEPDARVLVLTDRLAPFPIEFHLLPRRVSLLAKFPQMGEDPRASELQRASARAYYEFLERTGQLFTKARLRERIAQCDYVLAYGTQRLGMDGESAGPIEVSFDLKDFHLREVARVSPWAVLYRREEG
jgi:hypothetical protein